MNKSYKSRLSSLRTDMAKTLRRWNRHDVYPTLSDISNTVKKWKSDIDTLGVHDDLRSSTYNEAQESVASAYENRDDRNKAMSLARRTYNAIEKLEEELESPDAIATSDRINAKSMFGASLHYHGVDNRVVETLHPIKRMIDGLVADRSRDITYGSRIKTLVGNINDIGYSYYNVPTLRPTLKRIKSICDRIERLSKSPIKSSDENRLLSNLSKEIDNLAVAFNQYYGVNELPQLTPEASESIDARIKAIYDLTTRQPFESPQSLTYKIARQLRDIRNEMVRYDNTPVKTVDKALSFLEKAYKASSSPSVKSLFIGGWDVKDVQDSYNNAMNEVANLHSELPVD